MAATNFTLSKNTLKKGRFVHTSFVVTGVEDQKVYFEGSDRNPEKAIELMAEYFPQLRGQARTLCGLVDYN